MVWNYQNAHCSFEKFIVLFIVILAGTSLPFLIWIEIKQTLPKSVAFFSLYDSRLAVSLHSLRGYASLCRITLTTFYYITRAFSDTAWQWRNDGVAAASSDGGGHWW